MRENIHKTIAAVLASLFHNPLLVTSAPAATPDDGEETEEAGWRALSFLHYLL